MTRPRRPRSPQSSPRPGTTPDARLPAPACLGLTGGIGAGKSAALDAFARAGAAVLSSDDVVRRLYSEPGVVSAVRKRFGPGVIDAGGAVDRAALAASAFDDPEALRFLEGLLHPRIGSEREAWVTAQRALTPPPPLLVCEVPLLFEARLEDRFDAVLVVTAPDDVRRRRVEARGQDFDGRAAHQVDEARKVAAADMAFVNDGTLDDLEQWVGAVMARFRRGVVNGAG